MVTETEESDSDNYNSVIPPLIFLDYSDENQYDPPHVQTWGPPEFLSNTPSTEPTSEPGPTSKKYTKELTSELN